MRRLFVSLAALGLLVAVAPEAQAFQDLTPNQWALHQIHAPAAWQVATGAGVTVGVVDTGADVGHPDFGGRVSTVDCTNTSGSAANCRAGGDDGHGHGTHVSGIIAAANDGSGTAGTAPGANVIVAKVFPDSGGASLDDVNAGVDYLLSRGVAAINLSLGSTGLLNLGVFCNNSNLQATLNKIWNAGAVPVFASGNCGGGGGNYSGVNALVVGATDQTGGLAGYSNPMSGATWGLAAPGGSSDGCAPNFASCVVSTWPRSKTPSGMIPYTDIAGTSMAAPHVAGAVALLRSKGLSQQGAVNAIMGSLDSMACGSGCQGRLNLQRAAGAPNAAPPPPPAPTPPAVATPTTRRTTTTPRPATGGTGATGAAATTTTTPGQVVGAAVDPGATTTTEASTTTTTIGKTESAAKKRDAESNGFPTVPAVVAAVGLIGAVAGISSAGWRQRLKDGAAL